VKTPRARTALGLGAALLACVALATSCRTSAPARKGPQAPESPAPAATVTRVPEAAPVPRRAEDFVVPPLVRVGVLVDAPRVSIGAELEDVVVSEPAEGGATGRRWTLPRASFVAVGGSAGDRLRLVETGAELQSALITAAQPEDTLSVNATAYRGVVEVRSAGAARLTVVNAVNLEDYVRGVVPNELSPEAFPELEAQKAQAVAARTYALRNLGQYKAKGYDICATAACQVYRGRAAERPLSDQAVAETAGVIAEYQGAPIKALYTSTCGGHTEDGANIFEGDDPLPYLKGVVCAPERGAWARVKTRASRAPLGAQPDLNRDAALLATLGVVDVGVLNPKSLRAPLSETQARQWTARLLRALHRKGCESGVEPPLARRASFFQHAVGSLCWGERAKRLLGPGDADYLVQVEDRGRFATADERQAAALLIREGVLVPYPDNTLRPASVITRAEALGVLARLALLAGPPELLSAELRRVDERGITLLGGDGEEESLALDPSARLFRSLDGQTAAASELLLVPGDSLRYVAKQGRIVFLEADQPKRGAASDRSSRYYSWEVRLTPEQVSRGVARYGQVGRVRDLAVRRLGVSGRVIELAVMGSRGELPLKGLSIRWALGLRENLFVIDRELGPDGGVSHFVFTGKGWGHGVGLCQVGAYGMAKTGASYEQILEHYYTGITLGTIAALRPPAAAR
jgi:peptidoglycan hydrolase-like amidase